MKIETYFGCESLYCEENFLILYYFVLVFFSPFSIAITWLGEERANLSAFRMFVFVRFALVCFCLFPLPLGVWEGLRFVIVAFPGLFSYLFFNTGVVDLNMGTVQLTEAVFQSNKTTNISSSYIFYCPP